MLFRSAAPPPLWGVPATIAERLAPHFETPFFARGVMTIPALSLSHFRLFMETSVGPMRKLVEGAAGDPTRLAALRAEFEAIAEPYFVDNVVRQDYIHTRATAR